MNRRKVGKASAHFSILIALLVLPMKRHLQSADKIRFAVSLCPDPIDFRAFTVVNIYEDKNAYYVDSGWKRTPRPGLRNYLGHVSATIEEINHRELVLGTKSRSGDQWDIWEAVYLNLRKNTPSIAPAWMEMTRIVGVSPTINGDYKAS